MSFGFQELAIKTFRFPYRLLEKMREHDSVDWDEVIAKAVEAKIEEMSRLRNPTTTPIELDQFGQAVWKHNTNKNLFVERSYHWCDRVIVLDETEGRRVVDDTKFTTFDFTNWTPVTVEEIKKAKKGFKDIYDESGEHQATE